MRIRTLVISILAVVAMCLTASQSFASDARGVSAISEAERSVLQVFHSGRVLQQIDRGVVSGALTWTEAAALYAEQAVIRRAFISGKARHGAELSAKRAAFMLRMSQSTYARLAYNGVQRRLVERRVTWVW